MASAVAPLGRERLGSRVAELGPILRAKVGEVVFVRGHRLAVTGGAVKSRAVAFVAQVGLASVRFPRDWDMGHPAVAGLVSSAAGQEVVVQHALDR